MKEDLIRKFKDFLSIDEENLDTPKKFIVANKILLNIFEGVYEPSDESYFLLENIDINQNDSVLEIGSGSGLICISIAQKAKFVTGVDIDQRSIDCAKLNAKINNINNTEFILGDLFSGLTNKKFDLILANLPHIPASPSDISNDYVGRCVNGGEDGRKILDSFLEGAVEHLNSNGKIQIVQSELANLNKTLDKMTKLSMKPKISAQKNEPFGRTCRERMSWYKEIGLEIKYRESIPIETNYIITATK